MSEIPPNIGRRIGNLNDLPEELRSQLVAAKRDELEEQILQALRELDGVANIDEVLVAIYRATGKVRKRNYVANKLYRMAREGLVESVPKRKGVYRLPEPKEIWGHHAM